MRLRTQSLVALIAGSALALLLSALLPSGDFWISWLAGCALGIPAVFGLLAAWKFGQASSTSSGVAARTGQLLGWMMGLAFVLRLGLGVFFALALPEWGYDQPAQNAGYIYSDAYTRDQLAWQMADEGQPLAATFQQSSGDQYGGLLALSTLIYRVFSPDAHRPWLILLVAAFSAAAGIPFLWRGLQKRYGNWVAGVACWIFALYPESLLLGAAQMREPLLIGLSGIAFWAVLEQDTPALQRWISLGAALAGMVLISPPAGLFAGLICGGWIFMEHIQLSGKRRWLMGILIGLGVLVFVALLWNWFWLAAGWDSYLAERASGWIQLLSKQLPPNLFRVFLAGYGLAQPVLPATLFEPALPIMQTISIIRGLGWYLLAPFLVYGILAIWKEQPGASRRSLVWIAGMTAGWILIASLRAGGDMWDNPRYRTLALAWMALLVAWGWQYARQTRSPWLKRAWLVTGIFIAGFTFWYMGRYIPGIGAVNFFVIIGLIAAASLLVLAGGWLIDRRTRKKFPPVQE